MNLKVIEGSWEEILQHAGELQGRRLRVMVLPEPSATPQESLREFLGAFVGCIEGSLEPVAENAEAVLDALIAESHRAQGLEV